MACWPLCYQAKTTLDSRSFSPRTYHHGHMYFAKDFLCSHTLSFIIYMHGIGLIVAGKPLHKLYCVLNILKRNHLALNSMNLIQVEDVNLYQVFIFTSPCCLLPCMTLTGTPSNRNDKEAAIMKSQQYGCLNKTYIMTIWEDIPRRMRENSHALLTPQLRTRGNQWLLGEGESVFSTNKLTDRLSRPYWEVLNTT